MSWLGCSDVLQGQRAWKDSHIGVGPFGIILTQLSNIAMAIAQELQSGAWGYHEGLQFYSASWKGRSWWFPCWRPDLGDAQWISMVSPVEIQIIGSWNAWSGAARGTMTMAKHPRFGQWSTVLQWSYSLTHPCWRRETFKFVQIWKNDILKKHESGGVRSCWTNVQSLQETKSI